MTARLVDKEIALDVTVVIYGNNLDGKTLVNLAISEAILTHQHHDIAPINWDEQEITRDWTRNGKRRIRVDFKDRNTMPLFVTVTE